MRGRTSFEQESAGSCALMSEDGYAEEALAERIMPQAESQHLYENAASDSLLETAGWNGLATTRGAE